MIEIHIPGHDDIKISHLVSDYTGTLSVDGFLLDGVKERLNQLAKSIDIHIVTADTHGRVKPELDGVNCKLTILTGEKQDDRKLQYIEKLGPNNVVAIGNGNNDRKMLATAGIGIAICTSEGVSLDAVRAATILVNSPLDALDLLIYPDRLKATLRL
jgi:soluble P-type ATPase